MELAVEAFEILVLDWSVKNSVDLLLPSLDFSIANFMFHPGLGFLPSFMYTIVLCNSFLDTCMFWVTGVLSFLLWKTTSFLGGF